MTSSASNVEELMPGITFEVRSLRIEDLLKANLRQAQG
jgi:hypothetical protein